MGYSKWTSCSFCGRYHNQVEKLIDGRKCFICNKCVMVCFDLLIEELGEEFEPLNNKAMAIRRGAVEGELRWLREQWDQGTVSDVVYEER